MQKVMMGSLWSMLAAVMASHVAYADPRCTTVAECDRYISSLQAQRQALLMQQDAGSPPPSVPSVGVDWKLPAEGGNDSPERMNQYTAFDRCIMKNTNPDVRKAAAGALGYWWDDAHHHGDRHSQASVNLSAMPSGAYYLPTRDQLRERWLTDRSEFGNHRYLSSSVHRANSGFAHDLSGHEGAFDYGYRGYVIDGSAVRCVRAR